MMELIKSIASVVTVIINKLGYFGIALGMFIESACIPLPSELVLPLGGFMVAEGRLTLIGANIAVIIGSLMGSILAYWIGFYGGRTFILKYGKYFFVSSDSFYKAEKTFNKYGVKAVFFGRLLPVVRTFISLPAGITRMNFVKFIVYSTLGMLPWNFTLIFLGYKFSENYETVVRPIFKRFEHVVIAGIILSLLVALFLYIKKQHKKSISE